MSVLYTVKLVSTDEVVCKKMFALYRLEKLYVFVCEVRNTVFALILRDSEYVQRQLRKMKTFCPL